MDRNISQSRAESVVRDTHLEGREDLDAIDSSQVELQLLSALGRGSFGMVVLARQASSQRQVAVKFFHLHAGDPFGTRRVTQEASIMQLLRHLNIVQLLEVGRVGHYHCLVMELVDGGNLYQHVMRRGGLPEPEVMVMFDQILAAVAHCHAQRVAHRDLKLGNLLLDSQLNVKLADFGLSCHLPEGELVQGFRGTPEYSAPEVFRQEPYDPFAADLWSLGVILFAMLAGAMPFSRNDLAELRDCIQRGSYELPCAASPALEELLSSLLSPDPCDRPTAESARQQWWFDPLREEAEGEEDPAGCPCSRTPRAWSRDTGSPSLSWSPSPRRSRIQTWCWSRSPCPSRNLSQILPLLPLCWPFPSLDSCRRGSLVPAQPPSPSLWPPPPPPAPGAVRTWWCQRSQQLSLRSLGPQHRPLSRATAGRGWAGGLAGASSDSSCVPAACQPQPEALAPAAER
ncbi:MAP/microtubule affinity-regulating kinase 3-like isoform X2 [Oryctolagus cuniculus]|uniref:MAP/microtubule affinity-regulating kinase 3-like isoform X2 n=1 Tax=Oryctolagus cuniculus TaxID=9986 RepID=UPI003878FA08